MPRRPTPTARQAQAALSALAPAARRFLESLQAEYFPPRADGRQPYPLADLLAHLAEGERPGYAVERVAVALGLPVAYLRTLREAVGLVT
jgi:hypothetical protein